MENPKPKKGHGCLLTFLVILILVGGACFYLYMKLPSMAGSFITEEENPNWPESLKTVHREIRGGISQVIEELDNLPLDKDEINSFLKNNDSKSVEGVIEELTSEEKLSGQRFWEVLEKELDLSMLDVESLKQESNQGVHWNKLNQQLRNMKDSNFPIRQAYRFLQDNFEELIKSIK